VDGVALTSAVFRANRRQSGLSLFPFDRLTVPTLLVHHAEDGCSVCPYGEAVKLKDRARLVTVHGGAEPESGPCDPLSRHGYFGRETEVVAALRAWILGRPVPEDIP
jgi:hypothetical protein